MANGDLGYADAAVKLQRDWKITGSEPERLSFAKHIKGQALVTLVQKGLRYHHLSLTVDENGQQTKPLVPSMFFFGPESAGIDITGQEKESLLKASDSVRGVSPASTIAHGSKAKTRDTHSAAPEDTVTQPAKRGRKPAQSFPADKSNLNVRKVSGASEPESINGHHEQANHQNVISPTSIPEPAFEEPTTNGHHDDKMDVDKDVEGLGDVVMEDRADEFRPLIPTLTNGVSVDVQVAPVKAAELAPTSAILSVAPTQTISQALWRPTDTATLIARGETFCGVWNLSGQDLRPHSVKPTARSLFSSTQDVLVTAASWDPTGSVLAVAICSDEEAQVHLFDGQDLSLIEHLPASQRAIIMLEWHAAGRQLVAVALSDAANEPSNGHSGSSILCWDLTTGSGTSTPVVLKLSSTIFDIECSNHEGHEFFVASDDGVYLCTSSDEVVIKQHWSSHGSNGRQAWTFVKLCKLSARDEVAVVVAAESSTIWLPQRNTGRESAHNAPITSLQMRPRRDPTNGRYNSPEFCTSSEDGSIKIWQIIDDSLDCTQQLQFEPSSPIMSLSFSPDGFYLAAASYNTVCIWNAQHAYNLMANWTGSDAEWRGTGIRDDDMASAAGRSSVNGDGPSSADHTLAWHIDSKRLAYGLGSQVAIINFQR